MHLKRTKRLHIPKGLKNWTSQLASQVDLSFYAVGETEPQNEVSYIPCFGKSYHGRYLQRFDWFQRLTLARAFPVGLEFAPVQLIPFQNVAKSSFRKLPGDNAVCYFHRYLIFAVLRVKMRWSMIAIVNRDDDPEEKRLISGTCPF